jgi:hypothetical protein
MQYVFIVKNTFEEFVSLGKSFPYPAAPMKICHNPSCKRMVQFKKHGFYYRYFISNYYKGLIQIRRYICPICGCTISYIPHFCLPGFAHALEHIFEYIYEVFYRKGSIKACLSDLNKKNSGIYISRQLLYHYRKRFINNLSMIQIGLRQISSNVRLPENSLKKEERAKKVLGIIKSASTTIHSFSQQFHNKTNNAFLSLCKLL